VIPFPVDVYPAPVARFVRAVAANIGCPEDFLGAAALATLGAAIGYSLELEMTSTWRVRPIFYIAIVAPPGLNKSAALDLTTYPLSLADMEVQEHNKARAVEYQRAMKAYKAQGDDADPGLQPMRPRERQLKVDDVTTEALAELIADNPRGLLMAKDELASWFDGMDKYRQGKGGDRNFFMSVYGGGPIKHNRKTGDRKVISAPHSQLNIVGNLTPKKLGELSAGGYGSDGFLDRITFAFPAYMPPPDWAEGNEVGRDVLDGWNGVVGRLLEANKEDIKTPLRLLLTPEAKKVWKFWYDGHIAEAHRDRMPDGLASAWHKLRGICARCALVLHACRKASGEPVGDDVDDDSLARAIELTEYFKSHTRKVYAHVTHSDGYTEDGRAIREWIQRGEHRTFKLARLWNDMKDRFDRDKARLREEVSQLIFAHVIRRVKTETAANGKTPELYEAHPSLFSALADESPDFPDLDSDFTDLDKAA
jgi:hypothetical protein